MKNFKFSFLNVLLVVVSFSHSASALEKSIALHSIKTMSGEIYFHSQPSKTDILQIKQVGIKTLVNLRTAKEMPFNEAAYAKKIKLPYVSIPVSPETVAIAQVKQLAIVLEENSNYPVFIHCSSSNRAAMLYGMYLVSEKGYSATKAIRVVENLGLSKPDLKKIIKDFAKNPSRYRAEGCTMSSSKNKK